MTFSVKGQVCPECGFAAEDATVFGPEQKIKPGLLSVCPGCAMIHVVNDHLLLEPAPQYYLDALRRYSQEAFDFVMCLQSEFKKNLQAAVRDGKPN